MPIPPFVKHKTEERRCTDHFTACVKLSPHEVLAQHVVDVQKVVADFREASERRQASPSQTHGANKHFFTQSPAQKRLSIYNWNPGPRRGKEDAFEKQIAGKWHIITSQEASEYVDHDILTGRFHVTHCASTRTPSTPTSMSSPSTFMTPGETCPIKSWKGNRDGSCKVYFHVPHFVGHQSAAR